MTGTRSTRVTLLVENVALARDHRLRKQARTLVEAGCVVTVICRRDPGNKGCVPGVRVIDYPPPPEGSSPVAFAVEYLYSLVMAATLLVRVMLTGGLDVVQVSSTPDIYPVLCAPLRWAGRLVVFDFRDLSPETFAKRYGHTGGPIYRVLLLLERLSLRLADRVLVVNESLRKVALDRGGVPAERISVVGNGPLLVRVGRRAPRPDLRGGRRHLCVWVGMIGPQDGLDLAVRAFARLVDGTGGRGRTDCSLAIVGVGDATDEIKRMVGELGIDEYVTFPGWAEEDLVFDYLSTADIGIEPNPEPFVSPVKAMEFMAVGLPFVAFDLAETRALAGPAAAYVPFGDVDGFADQIDELLSDSGMRESMGTAGRKRVLETVAWERQADRYLAALVPQTVPTQEVAQ